ncbi:hypothetical protein NXV90_27600 [Bacteroides ovatus]|nr:hypothetical protein [Bacteroides ovatus]
MLLLSPENRSESNPYFHLGGDNMVLQQQSEVTFSGTATSGKRVQATASWNNKKSKRMLMQKVNGNFLSKHR